MFQLGLSLNGLIDEPSQGCPCGRKLTPDGSSDKGKPIAKSGRKVTGLT